MSDCYYTGVYVSDFFVFQAYFIIEIFKLRFVNIFFSILGHTKILKRNYLL